MKRYAKYKDSGVEWIGDIPEGWEKTKFKYETLKSVQYGLNLNSDKYSQNGIRFLRTTDINDNGNICNDGVYLASNDVLKEQLLEKYDFLISRSGTLGRTYLHLNQGLFSYAGYLVRFNFGNLTKSKFIFYFSKSKCFSDWIILNTIQSTIGNVNGEKYANLILPLPPLKEQDQIVAYLDEKTSHIDKLLDISKRKIGLLKEQRSSIINQVITKGLNPNAKMKHSGVEWIGDIPEGWGVLPLKYFGVITLGKMLTPNEKSGYQLKPYLRSINVQADKINLSDVKEMWFSNDELERLKLKRGDLLLNEGGDVGRTSVWENELEECYFQNSINRVQFNKEKDLYYYFYYLSQMFHFTGYYKLFVNTVSISHLTKEKLEAVKFIRPPLIEQEKIIAYLDEKTSTIEKSISIEERRIGLLKEYRQSIISQVVTGKIKVTADE